MREAERSAVSPLAMGRVRRRGGVAVRLRPLRCERCFGIAGETRVSRNRWPTCLRRRLVPQTSRASLTASSAGAISVPQLSQYLLFDGSCHLPHDGQSIWSFPMRTLCHDVIQRLRNKSTARLPQACVPCYSPTQGRLTTSSAQIPEVGTTCIWARRKSNFASRVDIAESAGQGIFGDRSASVYGVSAGIAAPADDGDRGQGQRARAESGGGLISRTTGMLARVSAADSAVEITPARPAPACPPGRAVAGWWRQRRRRSCRPPPRERAPRYAAGIQAVPANRAAASLQLIAPRPAPSSSAPVPDKRVRTRGGPDRSRSP